MAGEASWTWLVPQVAGAGFIDGFHICSIAVMLFFIAFLFSIRKSRSQVMLIGGAYIFGVFLAYLLIGLAILKAVQLSDSPHLMARLGAYLIIAMGAVNIKDYFFPGKWFSLRLPDFSKPIIEKYMHRSSAIGAFVAGVLVGICAFPCAGGIYTYVLTILVLKVPYAEWLGYLVLYNLMFVLPLILILLASSNQRVVEELERWETKEKKYMKLLFGIILIAMGLFILYGGML